MDRLYCILVSSCFVFMITGTIAAQDAIFCKLPDGYAPVIDGKFDSIWNNIEVYDIDQYFLAEVPTLDLATWQGAWNDTAIFILVTVEDDDFYPDWESGETDWMSDRAEIYLDVNDTLDDGKGPSEANTGHYQFAPDFIEGFSQYVWDDYNHAHQDAYAIYGYTVNDNDYIYEYSVRIADLTDKEGSPLNPYTIDNIGFDITIIDRDYADNGRRRAVWKNIGEKDESWVNMDDCGKVTLSTDKVEVKAMVKKLPGGLAPAIDGLTDDLWTNIEKHYIQTPFQLEEPTIDVATWQSVWNDTALFVIVTVEEDDFCPPWCEPKQNEWMSDRAEIYLDVNDTLEDGIGVVGYPNGHYEITPSFQEGEDNYIFSGNSTEDWYYQYGYQINDPHYTVECAIPFTTLEDKYGDELIPMEGKEIGFDVTIIDRDEGEGIRNRVVWMNDGTGPTLNEAWSNMDDCGVLKFSTDEIEIEVTNVTPAISADKYIICPGEKSHLQATYDNYIGDTLYYFWSSSPPGFSSDVSNPEVSPAITTLYTVDISNRFIYGSASLNITVNPAPVKPEIRLKGNNILICVDSGMYYYNWYYEDEQFINETKQFFEVKNPLTGNYYVETGYENQCRARSDPFNLTLKSGNLKSSKPFIEIYPIPNSGIFTLNMISDETGRVIVKIRDNSGISVKSLLIDKNTEVLSEEISIENIPKGVYMMDILFNNITYCRRILFN